MDGPLTPPEPAAKAAAAAVSTTAATAARIEKRLTGSSLLDDTAEGFRAEIARWLRVPYKSLKSPCALWVGFAATCAPKRLSSPLPPAQPFSRRVAAAAAMPSAGQVHPGSVTTAQR